MVTAAIDIKRCLLLGRKAMTNLDSILKSRDITLPTKKVRLVKAMAFLGTLSFQDLNVFTNPEAPQVPQLRGF